MSKDDHNVWENKTTSVERENLQQGKLRTNSLDIDFRRILSIWPFILLFGLLGYAAGSIYLRYANKIYSVSTSISLEQKEEVSLGQAFFGNPRDPFNDKIAYFRSPSIAAMLVDSLGLQYNAEAQGRFKNKNFYGIIKWHIIHDDPKTDIPEINFSIMPKPAGFHFVSGKIEGDGQWGVPFLINKVKVVVQKLEEFNSQSPIYCYSTNRLAAAFALSRGIDIATTKESNIINIKYSDVSSERAIDILNELVKQSNDVLERDKSQGFSQAIHFIEQRMAPLRRELDSIENSLAQFKASRGMVGGSANSEMYLEKMKDYDKELTEINILENTISSVEEFIKNPALKDADLSFVGVNNPGLQSMLMQYQQMRQQRDKLALTAQETNPTLMLADRNLADMRSNMDKQLSVFKNNLRIAQATYQEKIGGANAYLRSAPIAEKELIDKTRFQNIKEALYLTLLQKREEAAIAKASVTVNTKVLYPPVKLNASLKPSKMKVLSAAIIIGLIIPIVLAFLKEVMNKKIISKKQLQGMTNIPVIAELEQADNPTSEPFIIEGSQRSMFGEQIRSLRTNINFYSPAGKSTNYILITSSVSGEGKSFLSMNLAKSYSLQGKKVALLEFDLRRPKLSKALGINNTSKTGITSVLIGKSKPGDIVQHIVNEPKETLHLFPAGAIPPNPQELISGEYIDTLKSYLDANYDIVIIDTPPFGIVADAQILGAWADVALIITRFQQTVREQILEINEWNDRRLFKSMALVFNGVKNSGYFGNKYGYYYYKRKYGYNYYSSDKEDKTS
ncbi:MAG: polysaccharide biosynthesis tyrosine autokinase [Ferruginibacter sp.]